MNLSTSSHPVISIRIPKAASCRAHQVPRPSEGESAGLAARKRYF